MTRDPGDQTEYAVRPLTASDTPQGDEVAQLKQLCRYLILHATFVHSWSNDRQADDGGEVLYGSLSLRNGSYGAEDDLNIAPAPNDANDQLFFGHALAAATRGRIVRNEDEDIGAGFVAKLKAAEADFAALGVDIDRIRSRINI